MRRIFLWWRNTRSEFSRFWCDSELSQTFYPMIFITTLLFAGSSFYYSLIKNENFRFAIPISMPYWIFFLILFMCLYLGMLIWALCIWRKPEGKNRLQSFLFFSMKHPLRNTITAVSLAFLIIFTCMVLTSKFIDKSPILFAIENPGGFFALVTGFATLVGTYFAVHSILEMKHSISSFPQLVDRITNLINGTEGTKEPVRILSYSIQPGAWNVDKGTRKRLYDALRNPKVKIEAVVLNNDAHKDLLSKFVGKPSIALGEVITDDIKDKFHKECESLIENIQSTLRDEGCEGIIIPKAFSEMPGYYFFVSADRAIFSVTVEMPRINNPEPNLGDVINVEALGFETTDSRIVQMLRREYERYAKPSKPEESISQLVNKTADEAIPS